MPLFAISTQILLRNVNTPAFKAWVSLTNYLSLTAETSVQQTNAHLEHLDSEFRTAGLGVNAVRIAEHRQRSEAGCIASLLGGRATTEDLLAIGVDRVLPR